MAADEALTVDIRGARSLKWIKGRIEAYLHTDRPVTAVLQVTVVVDKPATATVNERNAKHNAIRTYIADHLKAPTEVAVGVTIEIPFEQDEVGLVHYVTRSGYVDNLKSTYMKRRLGRIQAELRHRYPQWNVRLNFLLTKPLEYISMGMAQSAVAEEKRMIQARDEVLEVDMDLDPIDATPVFLNVEHVDTPMVSSKQE